MRCEKVNFAYYHGLVLREVSLHLGPGERAALIGPNGSGKTTLLRVLSGVLSPQGGRVWLDGRGLSGFSRREIGQRIAVVPQSLEVPFGFTVEEMVLLGRTPYLRPWRGVTGQDRQVAEETMAWVGIAGLSSRLFNELSGGERQQVILAMALAQEPEILLLDEPTVHLDIAHQLAILDLVRRLNQEKGLTVFAAIHDLNLAALYFRRLLLMDRGRLVADGSPQEVLSKERIAEVFGAEVGIQKHPAVDAPQIMLLPRSR
ncbi:MAG: ABC transporter ATP-binding protein [Chloroflexi bacterium]|nr:ABC transporter ATP-binding protein [Chloroflexota bacterium]